MTVDKVNEVLPSGRGQSTSSYCSNSSSLSGNEMMPPGFYLEPQSPPLYSHNRVGSFRDRGDARPPLSKKNQDDSVFYELQVGNDIAENEKANSARDLGGPRYRRKSSNKEEIQFLNPNSGLKPKPVVRGGSFREPSELRQQVKQSEDRQWHIDAKRGSVPVSSPNLLSVSYEDVRSTSSTEVREVNLRRVRSFKTTTKGVINRGDSFRRKGGRRGYGKSTPPTNTPSSSPLPPHVTKNVLEDETPLSDTSYFKVVVLGAPGTGKSSLTHQFMTSEYIAFDTSIEQGEHEHTVSVLLNGEESTLEFVDDLDYELDLEDIRADAYMVVFSIAHRDTFETAVHVLSELRMNLGTDRATILVGNKSDLVRKRRVKTEEALEVALQYEAKYTETSAALNHHVDELLVGMLNQIRFKLNPSLPEPVLKVETKKNAISRIPSFKGPINFLSRLFRRGSTKSKRGQKAPSFS